MNLENRNQIYTFTIRYLSGVTRTIALRPAQALIDLHNAIHQAIGWYGDYGLHAFFLSNVTSGVPPVILCPDYYDFNYFPFFDDADQDPPLTDEVSLSALQLSVGQKLTYLFDDAARYCFEIELTAVTSYPDGPDNQLYPHVIDAEGEMPPQFEDEEY